MSALAIANAVLEQAGGVHGLVRSNHDTLRRVKGLGTARAAQVLAALELGRRALVRRPPTRTQLRSPREVAAYLLPIYGGRPVEQFGMVMLDAKHRVLRTAIVSVGALDSTVVHPRDVFREADDHRCRGDRRLSQPPVGRSVAERRRHRVDRQARGGRGPDGHRRAGPPGARRRTILQRSRDGTPAVETRLRFKTRYRHENSVSGLLLGHFGRHAAWRATGPGTSVAAVCGRRSDGCWARVAISPSIASPAADWRRRSSG